MAQFHQYELYVVQRIWIVWQMIINGYSVSVLKRKLRTYSHVPRVLYPTAGIALPQVRRKVARVVEKQ